MVPNLRRAGLDGLAITDHNILSTDAILDPLIMPGMEISSSDGHIIALGILEPVPRGLSGDETIRRIRQLGGVSIIAHPYDLFRSAINPQKLSATPDAVEVINSASILHSLTWKRAKDFAEKNNLPQTAGSDSHIPETIGKAFTTVDCEEKTCASVLDSIRNGKSSPTGRPYRLEDRLRKIVRRR